MLQTVTIPCKGGLNLSSTSQELLSLPNQAIQLVNMEPDKNGGYRRISGFLELTATGGSGEVKGAVTYLGGYLVVQDQSLWHSFNGTTWLKVNTDAPASSSDVTVGSALEILLGTPGYFRPQFGMYSTGSETHIYGTTGTGGNPFYLLIVGTTQATAAYTFREVSLGTELVGARWMTVFQDQVVLAGTDEKPSSIIYSSFASTDLTVGDIITPREKYDGATSGEIAVKRPITGIAEHRESLYIFTDRTIDKVSGLREGNPVVTPVSRDIGCVSGHTIQEVGGDLLFLAPDGLRTVAQTERIDDVELGVVSTLIYPITERVLTSLDEVTFASCVIRKKNQYRLWYTFNALDVSSQKGIIAVLTGGPNGIGWEFSELKGWEVNCAHSGEDTNGIEVLVSGDSTGKVYLFETGSTFNGARIPWTYQTPYTDLGDIGIRKNIHDVKTRMRTEGVVNASLEIKYDYDSNRTPQPASYSLGELTEPYLYGEAVYGAAYYGIATQDNPSVYAEGSGFTVSLRYTDTGQLDDPFTIESILLNYTPSGRI